jgi:hypothetical protein
MIQAKFQTIQQFVAWKELRAADRRAGSSSLS